MIATLVLQDVARHFGGVPAVDKLSLQVPAGQITGLIGPNGAGKTTVVNLITGLLHLSSGKVLLDGRDVSREEAPDLARAGVARTFQNIRLVPDASVLENVVAGFHRHEKAGLWANLLGLPSARAEAKRMNERAMALLERFDMTALAEHRAGGLSYGHQRRIEMMQALATNPKLLLLDEPVAGMTDEETHRTAELFLSLQGTHSLVVVEHDMKCIHVLTRDDPAKRVTVLHEGSVLAEGSLADVQNNDKVVDVYLGR